MIGYQSNAVIGSVGGHDRISSSIDNLTLIGRKIGGSEFSLSAMDGTTVETLLGSGVRSKMFNRSADVSTLKTFKFKPLVFDYKCWRFY